MQWSKLSFFVEHGRVPRCQYRFVRMSTVRALKAEGLVSCLWSTLRSSCEQKCQTWLFLYFMFSCKLSSGEKGVKATFPECFWLFISADAHTPVAAGFGLERKCNLGHQLMKRWKPCRKMIWKLSWADLKGEIDEESPWSPGGRKGNVNIVQSIVTITFVSQSMEAMWLLC